MDIILNLFQQLAITLSPTEFVIIISIIIAMTIFCIRYIFKLFYSIKQDGIFQTFLFKNKNEEEHHENIKNISKNVELLMTTDDFDKKLQLCFNQLQRIINILEQDISKSEHRFELVHQLTRQEIERRHIENKQDIIELKQMISKVTLLVDAQTNSMRIDNNRLIDILQRLNAHIENLEETSKLVIPEFRNYHRELTSELKDISNDIALVERSIQNQINISNAIKLR